MKDWILFKTGVLDSLRFSYGYRVFANSSTIRWFIYQSFLINVVLPCTIHCIYLGYPTSTALQLTYLLAWLIPSFFIRLVINTLLVNEISSIITTKRSSADSIGTMMATVLYDICLVMFLTLQSLILSFCPPIYFIHSCLLMSFISFDYKWASHNILVPHRIQFFDQHWSYFIGFGFILGTLEFLLPFPYNSSLLSFMASIMLIVSNQLKLDNLECSDYTIDIFTMPNYLSSLLFDKVLWFMLFGRHQIATKIRNTCFWRDWK